MHHLRLVVRSTNRICFTRLTSLVPILFTLGLLQPIHAQIVQVPIGTGCTVVAPGIGGNVALNRVGKGGIVCMRDGFDNPGSGGNFTFTGPAVDGWLLKGDLSFQTALIPAPPIPGANPPIQTAGVLNTVNIQTYNKNLRPTEVGNPDLSRSKGRVIVKIKGDPCDSTFFFDILKQWGSSIPPINGADCWPQTNQSMVFSVDPVSSDNPNDMIGWDQYYWKLTNGAGTDLFATPSSAYFLPADRSVVTVQMADAAFQAWFTGGPYTMSCCYGRCNPWDGATALLQATTGTTCVTKTMNPAAVTPTFTPASPLCLSTSATTQTITYSTVGITSASWTGIPANWTSSATLGSLTLGSMDGNPATLQLTAVGPCGSNVYTYQINRVFTTAQLTTTPTAIACLNGDGTSTVTVSVGPNALGNLTCWTAAPAWPFTTNGANSSRTYTVPAGTCAGTYTFTARSCACTAVSSTITVRVRPTNPTLTGPACVPSGGGAVQTYNSSTPCGTTSFAWSNTLGMTGSSTINSIGYTPAGTANGVVQVIAIGVAGSGCDSNPVTIPVNRNPVAPVVTPGQTCYSTGANTVATFASSGGAATQWAFQSGLGNITTATGATATIVTNGLSAGTTYTCTASITNSCGTATAPFSVTIPAYTVTLQVTESGFTEVKILPQQGSTNYSLYNCTTMSVVQGPQTGNAFTLSNGGAGSFSIIVDPLPAGGCVQRPPCQNTLFNSAMAPQGGNNNAVLPGGSVLQGDDGDITISPNPNTGNFQVSITRAFELASATLFDAEGRRVAQPMRLAQGQNNMDFGDLKPGVYVLRTEVDGKVSAHNVVIADE